jgi:ferredoxin
MLQEFYMLKTIAVKRDEITVTYRFEKSGREMVVTLKKKDLAGDEPENNLLAIALKNRIDIATACGGNGSCGACNVRIVKGEGGLSPAEADELAMFTRARGAAKILRLSCQSHPDGSQDIVVIIPDDPFKAL